jgi:hypothetical protein
MTENNTFNTDFNLDDEAINEPLIPNDVYNGTITAVSIDPEKAALNWTVTFNNNDGAVMNDEETPVDGTSLVFTNWFPRPGDENLRTTNGKMTKRQSKINQIKRFAEEFGVNLNTPQEIAESIANSEWVGKEVIATVSSREYNGQVSNEIKRLVAA